MDKDPFKIMVGHEGSGDKLITSLSVGIEPGTRRDLVVRLVKAKIIRGYLWIGVAAISATGTTLMAVALLVARLAQK